MTKICRLLSTVEGIPHQTVRTGDCLTIGRNRRCRIRDITCSRSHCTVTFDGQHVCVKDCKTHETQNLSNGQLLSGNGFQYKIVFVDQTGDEDEDQMDATNGFHITDNDKSSADTHESNDLDQTMDVTKSSGVTEWMSLCANRVHICKFLGGGRNSASIAAFDFDDTLVTPKSGNKFAIDSDDWRLIDKQLPKKIEKLIERGYRFVVISNQLPISQGRYKLEDIQHRFESALTDIGVPCLVMLAAFDDIYRKPRPGLWQLLANELNDKPIDLTTSFFVGDAAGRKKQLNGRSDHSSVDLLFAANSGIPFLTPERFLTDVKPKIVSSDTSYCGFDISVFRPKKCDNNFIATQFGSDKQYRNISDLLANYSSKLHVIIFCGLPASGKSSFYTNYLQKFGYIYISRDELKTMERCHKKCETSLKNRQNCVIDNINVEPSARKQWVALSEKYSAVPLLFFFDVSVEQSLHNNKFRRIIGVNSPVTDLVIRSQNKNLTKPMATENFETIYKINFVSKFRKQEHELLYFMYLSER
ncbi:unnamed protein product [Oppiella nova]|uniref:FHA domain-containing protein n=1 Tax=Oppiella nova TaxID=334625 RepID=A0A7R9QAE9_9ACAR|nr:unnamed protein product [Oppiella nova]CAG2161897.1 unnamed protein product [Oppiella nova]